MLQPNKVYNFLFHKNCLSARELKYKRATKNKAAESSIEVLENEQLNDPSERLNSAVSDNSSKIDKKKRLVLR